MATRLSDDVGTLAEVTLIDKSPGFIFGFSKLDVMFGKHTSESVVHPYESIAKPGVRFVQATIESIDPGRKAVTTDAGAFEADVLVIALGADLDPSATPGLVESGHEFYTVPGAFALRDVLASFEGGRRRHRRDIDSVQVPPGAERDGTPHARFLDAEGLRASQRYPSSCRSAFRSRRLPVPLPHSWRRLTNEAIGWHPERMVTSLDGDQGVAVLNDGGTLPFDLFLGVPVHRAPSVVVEAGLTVDGWIPVDPKSLETAFPDVFAVGDVTSVGTPKAGCVR